VDRQSAENDRLPVRRWGIIPPRRDARAWNSERISPFQFSFRAFAKPIDQRRCNSDPLVLLAVGRCAAVYVRLIGVTSGEHRPHHGATLIGTVFPVSDSSFLTKMIRLAIRGATMGMIKLLSAPIRSIVRFPLFQLAIVVAVILFLQSADENSAFGQIFNGLDKLVDATVTFFSAIFTIKSFTKSWLTSGFMIAYVYLGCLLILFLVRVTIRVVVDFIGRSNLFWLRNASARERGIEAYRAWVPFERIRPAHIPQEKWEQAFAWPANN
jgi:hypothetical protein